MSALHFTMTAFSYINNMITTKTKVVSVWKGFLFLCVLGMGYVILLWHSLSLQYDYFESWLDFSLNVPNVDHSSFGF